ncbi:unnamed protein product [Nesidiocoris tenuis]|uniref:Uncharacterized protein n=1 Tax=Nesidiocoris tenuis TaxID=355587 RepID=A0A6H5FTQ2_9HEMI|nr:unnamed protein product [Nesidiocoris tenuis]
MPQYFDALVFQSFEIITTINTTANTSTTKTTTTTNPTNTFTTTANTTKTTTTTTTKTTTTTATANTTTKTSTTTTSNTTTSTTTVESNCIKCLLNLRSDFRPIYRRQQLTAAAGLSSPLRKRIHCLSRGSEGAIRGGPPPVPPGSAPLGLPPSAGRPPPPRRRKTRRCPNSGNGSVLILDREKTPRPPKYGPISSFLSRSLTCVPAAGTAPASAAFFRVPPNPSADDYRAESARRFDNKDAPASADSGRHTADARTVFESKLDFDSNPKIPNKKSSRSYGDRYVNSAPPSLPTRKIRRYQDRKKMEKNTSRQDFGSESCPSVKLGSARIRLSNRRVGIAVKFDLRYPKLRRLRVVDAPCRLRGSVRDYHHEHDRMIMSTAGWDVYRASVASVSHLSGWFPKCKVLLVNEDFIPNSRFFAEIENWNEAPLMNFYSYTFTQNHFPITSRARLSACPFVVIYKNGHT